EAQQVRGAHIAGGAVQADAASPCVPVACFGPSIWGGDVAGQLRAGWYSTDELLRRHTLACMRRRYSRQPAKVLGGDSSNTSSALADTVICDGGAAGRGGFSRHL